MDSFLEQAGPAGYYRWVVVTEYLGLPRSFDTPVLDVGAHNGGFLDGIDANFKVGLDLFERPVHVSDWVQADATFLPFSDASFGHVFAFDIIEHVENDTQLLQEITRVLQPGGMLWMSTTCADYYLFPGGALQKRFERAWGHIRRGYTRDDLENMIPSSLSGELLPWNEPAQRYFYILHKIAHKFFPMGARLLMNLAYAWDKRYYLGYHGHWFAKLQKVSIRN